MAASPPRVGGPGHCVVGACDYENSWPGPGKGWASPLVGVLLGQGPQPLTMLELRWGGLAPEHHTPGLGHCMVSISEGEQKTFGDST